MDDNYHLAGHAVSWLVVDWVEIKAILIKLINHLQVAIHFVF